MDVAKTPQHGEVLAFAYYWCEIIGDWPDQLVFDHRLTTQGMPHS